MSAFVSLFKGLPGKPSHPPLTDVSIGTYTAAVAMLVLGAMGVEEEAMAHGALLAISLGLLVAVPTALTGLFDWLDLNAGSPARKVGTAHLATMLVATGLFAATWVAQLDGYRRGEVDGLGLVLGICAFAVLLAGGLLGGTLAYVYGIRVLKRPDVPVADALVPGRARDDAASQGSRRAKSPPPA